MKYRRFDSNGDYTFGNNNGSFLNGVEAIAQAIKTKVMLFSSEWWEDISIGIPMFESILGNVSSENDNMTYTLLITKRIKEIEEVIEVKNVKVVNSNRKLSFEIDVLTTEGEITVEVG